MGLSAGRRLGPYEILEPLGAGGMGEVYKGRDGRLQRIVAIKVLPASVADDAIWRQRFEREARVLAAISNSHICPIFDVGTHDGVDFLVMEFLEGETLASRLARGHMPFDEVLRHSAEIADALASAHRLGICHRDLKPGNIMLTRSGAKLLDFGLARRHPPHSAHGPDQRTISSELTATGTILGTVQYMSPEQLEGKEIDERTDIFACGAVMYEMATGRKAFAGQSQASVIAAILEHDPQPVSSLQLIAPPAFDRAVKRCLAKDPEKRWQSARDLTDELIWIAEESSHKGVPVSVAVGPKRTAQLSWSLVLALSVALLTLGVVHVREKSVDPSRVVFTIPRTKAVHPVTRPTMSPDGTRVVFPGPTASGSLLWIRPLDSPDIRPILGTDSAWPLQFWSPDGQSVGFFVEGKLKTIGVAGGSAQTIADAQDGLGGTWSPTGTIVFGPHPGPLFRVSQSGGPATLIRDLDRSRQEISHYWPHFLPDGRHFLYGVLSADVRRSGVYVASVDEEAPRLLIPESEGAVYSPPGYLLFERRGTLLAQAFDTRRLQLTGSAAPVPGPNGEPIATAWGLFSTSTSGVLSYVAARARRFQLNWYDRQGKNLGSLGEAAGYYSFVLSPDGKRLALAINDPKSAFATDVWIMELASGIRTRVTFDGGFDPVWSPSSRELAFTRFVGVTAQLFRKDVGGGDERSLFESQVNSYAQQWSADGTSIVFIDQDGKGLFRVPVSGNVKPQSLLQSPFAKDEFRLSADERWIAYNSLESGRWEVYVASFPSFGNKRQVSTAGGCQAIWRKDGKELFYLTLQGELMAVDVSGGSSLELGVPRPLFQTPILVTPELDQYAVTGDGQRFILGSPIGEEEPITVMVNWAAGLKR
jgi:eukaryotic-like serine/threonine-protein kinase